MATINRKAVREALATYLDGALPSAEAVFPYQVSDFAGKSPIVYITSSGSSREKFTGVGFRSTFKLNIHTFVLYPSENTGAGYTEQDAENILDDLEYQIASAILSIGSHALIKAISYPEQSNADNAVEIGGETYLHEVVPVEIVSF